MAWLSYLKLDFVHNLRLLHQHLSKVGPEEVVCLFVCLFISIMDMQYEMVIRMDRHKSKQLNSRHLSNKIPKNKLDIRH